MRLAVAFPIRCPGAVLAAALLACLAAAPAPAVAAAPLTGTAPPAARQLTGDWEIHPDPGDRGQAEGWSGGGPADGWTATTVPGVFDARPLASLFHGTVEWYRLTFTGPPIASPFTWALHFEQVRRSATVWLNGVRLGSNSDPYVPFTLPAPELRAGAPNTLVVRVDNRKGTEPREGWWNWGGITRPVDLVPLGAVVDDQPGLLPRLRCSAPGSCAATVLFDGTLTNRASQPVRPRVTVALGAPGGGPGSFGSAAAPVLAPGATERLRFTIPIRGTPDLWAPGHPALYDATITTLASGAPAQVDRMRIGLRSVTVRDGALLLNDRRVDLSGASIEEDMPGHGAALTVADMHTIVSELQAVHANVTRAQYPLSQELLDLLDQAGIMVWSQAPIYHRDELLRTASQRSAALATLRSSVLQTRDHPSVITHSVANELSPTPDTVTGTRDYLDDAIAATRDLDPTLPVSLDLLSYPGYPPQQTYRQFDLLGINNYFGWYPGRAPHSTASIASLAPYMRWMHREYPRQALVMTEFGAEANYAGPATVPGTYAYQSRYVQRTLHIVRSLPFIDGAIYWTLREFAVKPHWYGGGGPTVDHPRDSIHHKGLISYDGAPKPAFAVAAADFAATPLYVGGGPVTWGTVLAILAIALAICGLVALDLRLFRAIRAAQRRRRPPAGGDAAWRDGSPRRRSPVAA